MHFGLYLNPPTSGDDRRHIREVVNQSTEAVAAGFRAIWMTEHHFTGYNTYSDPLILAAHLSGRLPGTRLGFSVAIPALHHPVRFAEQVNLLDQLTEGNLIVGIASGFGQVEFAGFDRAAADRHALFDESIDLIFTLWAHQDGILDYATPHASGRVDGRIIPRSYRQPHPLVARGTVTPEYAGDWGRRGQPMLFADLGFERMVSCASAYFAGLEEADVSEDQRRECREWSAVVLTVHVAETDEKAEATFRPAGNRHLVASHFANNSERVTFEQLSAVRVAGYADRNVVGSPETVIRKIQPYRDAGINHVMCWMNIGGLPDAEVRRSQALFAREVMPAFA